MWCGYLLPMLVDGMSTGDPNGDIRDKLVSHGENERQDEILTLAPVVQFSIVCKPAYGDRSSIRSNSGRRDIKGYGEERCHGGGRIYGRSRTFIGNNDNHMSQQNVMMRVARACTRINDTCFPDGGGMMSGRELPTFYRRVKDWQPAGQC